MISSKDFDDLIYFRPHFKDKRKPIERTAGIDSEAYTDGRPFMFCTSYGDEFTSDNLIENLFSEKYINTHFFIYNIKYDSGALLYHLPDVFLKELWMLNKTFYNGKKYDYIPHKHLKISEGKQAVYFWDISQFYKMSLDKAAKRYLGKSKIEVRTKRFSPSYVTRNKKSIVRYCIQDAVLTEELGAYLLSKLLEFGITCSSLYSCASISARYFSQHSKIVDVWRFWKTYPEALKYAVDSYRGGKFEVTARGSGHAWEYDISSAYPYEIANLVNIRNATPIFSKAFIPYAVYGFIRVHIDNSVGAYLPAGVMQGLQTYPQGKYYTTITKQEYEYIITIPGVNVEIIDGWYLIVKRRTYPYRTIINTLFAVKSEHKGKDEMIYNVSKIIMNSFYGKCCQVIYDKVKGNFRAGMYWNPFYASVITANTRIAVCKMQNKYKKHCLAVHTDSVILDRPLDQSTDTGRLGQFEYVADGPTTIIACGMYEIDKGSAFKGFSPKKPDGSFYTWRELLEKNAARSRIRFRFTHVESWIECMAKNHPKSQTNVFFRDLKIIDLNCDKKRIWTRAVRGADLLKEKFEQSEPRLYIETEKPKGW